MLIVEHLLVITANRVSNKIDQLYDNICVCRSGSAADSQAISSIVQYYTSLHAIDKGDLPLVSTAATLFRDMCYNNKDRLQVGIIVAGWDKKMVDKYIIYLWVVV